MSEFPEVILVVLNEERVIAAPFSRKSEHGATPGGITFVVDNQSGNPELKTVFVDFEFVVGGIGSPFKRGNPIFLEPGGEQSFEFREDVKPEKHPYFAQPLKKPKDQPPDPIGDIDIIDGGIRGLY